MGGRSKPVAGGNQMQPVSKRTSAGTMFLGAGGFAALYAYATLPMGSAFRMGPGFFPVVVGSLLAVLGATILVQGLREQAEPGEPFPWRAVLVIPAALVAFGLMMRPFGLPVALFVTCFAAAFASRLMTAAKAAAIALGMTVLCVVLFGFILDLSLPLLGDLFR